MNKIRAQLHGMQRQQGVVFRDLLVVKKRLGSVQAFVQVTGTRQRLNRFRSGGTTFSVRRVSYRFIALETVYVSYVEDRFCKKHQSYEYSSSDINRILNMVGAAPPPCAAVTCYSGVPGIT